MKKREARELKRGAAQHRGPNRQALNLSVSELTIERLRQLCDKNYTSQSLMVTRLIDEGFERMLLEARNNEPV